MSVVIPGNTTVPVIRKQVYGRSDDFQSYVVTKGNKFELSILEHTFLLRLANVKNTNNQSDQWADNLFLYFSEDSNTPG